MTHLYMQKTCYDFASRFGDVMRAWLCMSFLKGKDLKEIAEW